MASYELDAVDHGILALLAGNARAITYQEIADQLGVAASTVRNRIDRLEAAGVIRGYHPEIDYEAGGWPMHVLIVCTVPHARHDELIDRLLDIQGVVAAWGLFTGRDNLHVEAVGTMMREMMRIANALHELDLRVVTLELVAAANHQPANHLEAPQRLLDEED